VRVTFVLHLIIFPVPFLIPSSINMFSYFLQQACLQRSVCASFSAVLPLSLRSFVFHFRCIFSFHSFINLFLCFLTTGMSATQCVRVILVILSRIAAVTSFFRFPFPMPVLIPLFYQSVFMFSNNRRVCNAVCARHSHPHRVIFCLCFPHLLLLLMRFLSTFFTTMCGTLH
jgi:hypothetical protein